MIKKKRILFVAMSDSIHTARWINQISDQYWGIYLFPSHVTNEVHNSIRNVKTLIPFIFKSNKNIKILFKIYTKIIKRIKADYYEQCLSRYIKRIKPDIIHTLETQNAAYLLMNVKQKYFKHKTFPIWWHTNWGSDIYLFGRLTDHREKIKEVLENCDYYSCECNRDVELARQYGFKKTVMPVYPNTGGFDLEKIERLRVNHQKPSDRKIIMLKGYQGWAGRALVALRALTLAKNHLSGYKLIIYSNPDGIDVKIAAEIFSNEAGVGVSILPATTSHDEIMEYHGLARISIGLSISDAISTSVLEAMAMGSFPVQSWTSAANEWIKDGVTGLLVPPEDPQEVAEAIHKALTDDELIDEACEKNWDTVKSRLDYKELKNKTIASYKKIMEDNKNRNATKK